MLDRHDQQQLERHIEQRTTVLHRIVSVTMTANGVVIASLAVDNVYVYIGAYVVLVLCASYVLFLLHYCFVLMKVIRLLRRRARHNEQEFTETMEAFLESVGKKS